MKQTVPQGGQIKMDRFSELQAFAAVVEANGFSAAARATGQSRSAVNRMVIGLEARLGVQLLNRTTRKVSPTSTGQALYERARQILDDLHEMEGAIASARTEPIGKLRMNAPLPFGDLDFSAIVTAFMVQYPMVQVDLTLESRIVDPVAEGFDLVVRIAEPDEETTLVDHRILTLDYIICAAPAYLAAHGAPQHPRQLSQHDILHLRNVDGRRVWVFTGPGGDVAVGFTPLLTANTLDPLLSAAKAGLGIALLPRYAIGSDLATGDLVPLLPDFSLPARMLQVIYPPARHLSAKVRLFTDFMEHWCDKHGKPGGGPVAEGHAGC